MDKKKWEQENVLRLVKKSRKGVLRVVFSRFGLMALLLILELVLLWMMWRWFNYDFEWFAAAQGVFTVLMFFHLFNSDMDATGKLTWMFLLAVIPIPASIFLWFTEKDVGHRTLKRRVQQRIDESRDLLHQDPEVLRDPVPLSQPQRLFSPVCQHGDEVLPTGRGQVCGAAGGAAKGGEVHFSGVLHH